MGCAEDKRKAGPDALAAPDAKKRATSDASAGLPNCSVQEDNTPLEGSFASSGVSKELEDCLEFDGESDPLADIKMKELEAYLESDGESDASSGTKADGDEIIVYDTICPGDLTALGDALAVTHKRHSESYLKRFEAIKESQLSFEEGKDGHRRHVKVLLDKEGKFVFAVYSRI